MRHDFFQNLTNEIYLKFIHQTSSPYSITTCPQDNYIASVSLSISLHDKAHFTDSVTNIGYIYYNVLLTVAVESVIVFKNVWDSLVVDLIVSVRPYLNQRVLALSYIAVVRPYNLIIWTQISFKEQLMLSYYESETFYMDILH